MAKPKTPSKPKTPAAKAATPKPKAVAARPGRAPVKRKLKPSTDLGGAGSGRLERLAAAVQAVREGRHDSPRTARLLASGAPKMAQKVVEEAAEVAIEAVLARRSPLINESVDLLYNLAVLWNEAGVRLEDLWTEMDRREATLGMAEKLPKADEV